MGETRPLVAAVEGGAAGLRDVALPRWRVPHDVPEVKVAEARPDQVHKATTVVL